MAENDAIQWPGFWWCAWGSMSSPDMFGGLRSLGVCVELLVTVVTSSPLVPSVVTGDLEGWIKRGGLHLIRGKCTYNQLHSNEECQLL